MRAWVGTAWSAPWALVVTVTNEDDPGTFTFSGPPRPRVGETFQATLADEDGGAEIDEEDEDRNQGWTWEPPSDPLPEPGASGGRVRCSATATRCRWRRWASGSR